MKPWTLEEKSSLRSMHLDPIRTDREKLITLVAHFQKGKGVWAVSEAGKSPITVSRVLARKIRDLVSEHKLDWLQVEGVKLDDASKSAVQRLRILSPSVDVWTDSVDIANYATIEVAAVSKAEVRDCWAWVEVIPRGSALPLHWAGTPHTAEEAGAPRVIINAAKPMRLDVAVALPFPGKTVGQFPDAKFTSEVAAYFPSSGRWGQTWDGTGCWLAQPLALDSPSPTLESYLPPGSYRIKVRIGCDVGEQDNREFILLSPNSWEELKLMLPT